MTDKEIRDLISRAEGRPANGYAKQIKKACELLLLERKLRLDIFAVFDEYIEAVGQYPANDYWGEKFKKALGR